jgi:hypothetical protein
MVWSHQKGERNETSPSDYLDWQKQSKVFESLNAWTGDGFTIAASDWTEQVQASRVAPGFFDLLFGTNLILGRHFVAEDAQPGNDHVVILNNRFWRDRFGADPSIVGTKLRMSGELYTVLGVAAPSPSDNGDSKMNVPLAFKPDQISRDNHYLLVMGKLKRGVTLEAANADMAVIAKQLAQSYPKTNQGLTVTVEPLKDDFLPKDPPRPVADDGCGRLRPPDRLCQYRQLAACLGHGPAERNCRASVAGRNACPDFPTISHRKPLIGDYGRSLGYATCNSRLTGFDELYSEEPIGNPV